MISILRQAVLPAALALGALAACSSIETQSTVDESANFDEFGTYAWRAIDDPFDDETLVERARAAIDAELQAAGMVETSRVDAELWIDLLAHIGDDVRYRDPNFAFYTVERYEVGTLTVLAIEPDDGRELWAGSASATLRDLERGFGVYEPRFTDANEERVWPIEDMVQSLFRRFPGGRHAK